MLRPKPSPITRIISLLLLIIQSSILLSACNQYNTPDQSIQISIQVDGNTISAMTSSGINKYTVIDTNTGGRYGWQGTDYTISPMVLIISST
jgi:hypothetical protein